MIALVKGKVSEAIGAATDRGIKYEEASRLASDTLLIGIPNHQEDRLIRWFGEPSELQLGEGYPAGTLLHYSNGGRE